MKRIKFTIIFIAVALFSLLAIQYFSVQTNLEYNKNIEDMNMRSQKISHVYAVLNLLLDVETGARGYVLTGKRDFLEPYEMGERRLPVELNMLYEYLSDDEINKLVPMAKARVEHASKIIAKKKNNQPIIAADFEDGKRMMDGIRNLVTGILDREEIILQRQMTTKSSRFVTSGLVAGSALSFLLVVASILYVLLEFRRRLQTEEKLKVSLATSEAVARNIDFGIIACKTNGEILFSNKWILNRVPLIKAPMDFFKNNPLAEAPMKMLIEGSIDSIEELEVEMNGEKKIFTVNSSPFMIEGVLRGTILSIIDTTTSVQKIASLVTSKQMADIASRAKSDFLAKMSHEIRTPLNSILGVGEILSLSKMDAEQAHCLEIFNRSAVTLNNLVNDILDLSKIEAGKIDIIYMPFSLKNLVASTTSIMNFKASQKGLLFTIEVDSAFDHLIGDEGRIRQILLNFLSNAIKFTEEGEVRLTVKGVENAGRKEFFFSVKDSGKGISPENMSKLFSNYQQENSTISKEFGGTGLGLALSRELARLMGGDIQVSSELSAGSEFTFHVFLEEAEGEYIEVKVNSKLKFKDLRILLVDDNQENRFVVKKYLSNFKFEITEAVDGEDAIETFKKGKFDLVLMDINMPKKDGLTATKDIRDWEKEENVPFTKIIALSANALSLEYDKALAVGCNDYLTKPVSRLKLITMIQKWFGSVEEETQAPVVEEEVASDFDNNDEDEIDEDIKALIPMYLESRLKDLATIQEAFSKKDIPIIKKLSHNIKGTALSYGQSKLDKVARAMEAALLANDMDGVEASIKAMEELLKGSGK